MVTEILLINTCAEDPQWLENLLLGKGIIHG